MKTLVQFYNKRIFKEILRIELETLGSNPPSYLIFYAFIFSSSTILGGPDQGHICFNFNFEPCPNLLWPTLKIRS